MPSFVAGSAPDSPQRGDDAAMGWACGSRNVLQFHRKPRIGTRRKLDKAPPKPDTVGSVENEIVSESGDNA